MEVITKIIVGFILIKILIFGLNYLGIFALDDIVIKIRNKANDLAKFVSIKLKDMSTKEGESE